MNETREVTECDLCGEVRECRYGPDPFIAEVYGDESRHRWWCDECYKELCRDI